MDTDRMRKAIEKLLQKSSNKLPNLQNHNLDLFYNIEKQISCVWFLLIVKLIQKIVLLKTSIIKLARLMSLLLKVYEKLNSFAQLVL